MPIDFNSREVSLTGRNEPENLGVAEMLMNYFLYASYYEKYSAVLTKGILVRNLIIKPERKYLYFLKIFKMSEECKFDAPFNFFNFL